MILLAAVSFDSGTACFHTPVCQKVDFCSHEVYILFDMTVTAERTPR